jgi:hypothetical protein
MMTVPRPRTYDDRTGRVFPDHPDQKVYPKEGTRVREVFFFFFFL